MYLAVFYRYKRIGMRNLELFWPFSILVKNLGDVLALSLSNLLVVQNFHLNPLHGHFENTKKRPPVPAATLLTIYHRIERE